MLFPYGLVKEWNRLEKSHLREFCCNGINSEMFFYRMFLINDQKRGEDLSSEPASSSDLHQGLTVMTHLQAQ